MENLYLYILVSNYIIGFMDTLMNVVVVSEVIYGGLYFTRDLLYQDSVHFIVSSKDKSRKWCTIWKGVKKQKGRKLKIDESTFLVTKTKGDLLCLFTYRARDKIENGQNEINNPFHIITIKLFSMNWWLLARNNSVYEFHIFLMYKDM